MSKFLSLISIAIFGIVSQAIMHADPAARFPVGLASWTVSVSPSTISRKPMAPSGNAIQSVEVTQNDGIRSSLATYYSGRRRITWDIPGTSLLLTEDSKGTAFLTSISPFYDVPYSPSIFTWVTPEVLDERHPISYNGKLCYHYKSEKGEAWVDSKSALPVALDDRSTLATYSFHGKPAQPLEMPPKYKKVFDNYSSVMGIPKPKQGINL